MGISFTKIFRNMKEDFLNLGVSGVGRKRNDKRSISGIIGVCGRCSIDKRRANNAIKRQQTSGSGGASNFPQKGHYHVHGKESVCSDTVRNNGFL
jgi:hypothetical protein